jgi:hypothetical protein
MSIVEADARGPLVVSWGSRQLRRLTPAQNRESRHVESSRVSVYATASGHGDAAYRRTFRRERWSALSTHAARLSCLNRRSRRAVVAECSSRGQAWRIRPGRGPVSNATSAALRTVATRLRVRASAGVAMYHAVHANVIQAWRKQSHKAGVTALAKRVHLPPASRYGRTPSA